MPGSNGMMPGSNGMMPGMMPGMMMAPQGGMMMMGGAPQPMMTMQGGGAPGSGPIPLEAFHTTRPTPTITPHVEDKFDFINGMISSSSKSKGMSSTNGLL